MSCFQKAIPALIGALFLLSGCAGSSPEFSTYVKPEVDFANFKTYHWQEVRPETAILQAQSDLVHRLIVQTVDEELRNDGLKQKAVGGMSVTYHITVSPQKSFWRTLFAAESVTPGTYNQRSAEAQESAVAERKLRQGVLVIELRDRSDDIVWSGRASAIVHEAKPGRAVEAVRKIMEDYPPL